MYLHCHSCGWEQDDFWDDNYHPWKDIYFWKYLIEKENFDEIFKDSEKTYREIIAQDFESRAKNIRNMVYRTLEEYKKLNPNRICPKCKNQTLDIV